MEKRLAPAGELVPARTWAAKAAEHAGRLAAVPTLYADPDARMVTGDAMAQGIALAQYYAGEMMRLSGLAAVALEPIREEVESLESSVIRCVIGRFAGAGTGVDGGASACGGSAGAALPV